MKNIIFLDIDGVINPNDKSYSFGNDIKELRLKLIKKNKLYISINTFELEYVYFNWDKTAIQYLKSLCTEFNASIVISSDWRNGKTVEQLKLLFEIHDLENFVIDKTPELNLYRDEEVKQYLKEHTEIEKFVVIDDNYEDAFTITFPNNFVHCDKGIFNEDVYILAKKILKK